MVSGVPHGVGAQLVAVVAAVVVSVAMMIHNQRKLGASWWPQLCPHWQP